MRIVSRFMSGRLKMSNKCYYCGHELETVPTVNHVTNLYVGGQGLVSSPICDDVEACIARVEVSNEGPGSQEASTIYQT